MKKPHTPAAIQAQAQKVLAQLDGEIRLRGPLAPVEVLRDRWGIPHIYAENAHDLFFAQGFVVAQDRLFQIDLWRRGERGETAEILGKDRLEADRFARLLKYRGDLDAEWRSYSPDARDIATAFTDGINACIHHMGERLPIEFQILGYRPAKWRPEDVLSRLAAVSMASNFEREVFRAALIDAIGLERARQLAPTYPRTAFAPEPGLDLSGIDFAVLDGYSAATESVEFRPRDAHSNGWVIAGRRSASGKPLLANDPHREIGLPALRYLVHLHAPGWHVIGAAEPALPGITVGHNERIAWGFTTAGYDQADLFVETLNPHDHDLYRAGDRWEKVRVVREKVKVRGERKQVELELRFTRHGPIIHEDGRRHRAVALKWVGAEPGAGCALGALALCRAGSWTEFLEAARAWKLAAENLMYADVDGNIGWVAAGMVPVRKGFTGLLPVPGDGGCAWERYLDVEELPQELNPARGYIATANNNTLPPGYRPILAYDWDAGYRIQRIKDMLDAEEIMTPEYCQTIQQDVVSYIGRALVRLIKKVRLPTATLEKYADILRDWDCSLSADAPAGPLYAVWLREVHEGFYKPRLPRKFHDKLRFMRYPDMFRILSRPTEKWFGAEPRAARDAFLRKTFARAVRWVCRELGDDPSGWSWGRLHTVTFHHPLEELGQAYEQAFNLGPLPRPGDAHTQNTTRHDQDFEQVYGASYRQVFDLADWDLGLATSAPGQSGQPGSPHYGDLITSWAKGVYFPLAFSRPKVEEVAQHRLILQPPS